MRLGWAALCGLVVVAGAGAAPADRTPQQADAERRMTRALASLRDERLRAGPPIEASLDPARTGIIGDEFTPLTTSLGEVEAKRASANPAFASLVAGYLQQAGAQAGDPVAVGASGSFPGLTLATLCAARALDLRPIVIYSVGSSMYGANLPGWTFVDMLAVLRRDGVLPYDVAAVSPGGDQDGGGGVLFDESGSTLVAEARRLGRPLVEGATLAERIQWRLRAYERAAGDRPVRAFVNIGGASASFGDTPASLEVPNGLVRAWPAIPDAPARGLLFEFAARKVPVIHLLHVRGLAKQLGLPYDPDAGGH